jgi:predicted CoA-binding protein
MNTPSSSPPSSGFGSISEDGLADDEIARILTTTRRIAMVGASNRPTRPSHEVMHFLLAQGYDVTPVNPGLVSLSIHERPVVSDLSEATPLDMVDFFRDPNDIAEDVNEAIRLGARTIWMQIGVVNDALADIARDAGLNVVMNRCPKIEIARLGIGAITHA